MATISLTIPDAALDRVAEAFTSQYPGRTIEEVLLDVISSTVCNAELPVAQVAWTEAFKQEVLGALAGAVPASTVQADLAAKRLAEG